MTPEGKIKAKLKRELAKLACEYDFWPVQMGIGATTLDCLICAGGRFVAIETKAKGKKPTPRQEHTMEAILKASGYVFVVDDDESMYMALSVIEWYCDLAKDFKCRS